ncbi:hypothetical protein K6V92_04870 [Cupriavidus respiraculi]|nr:hypothetical protein [Cupriavidus respiraculi]
MVVLLTSGAAAARTRVGVGVYLGPPVAYGYPYGPYYGPYYPRYYYAPPVYVPPVVAVPVSPPPPVQYIEQSQVAPPPPAASSGTASAPMWHHCENPEGYYPYVQHCPGGWKQVPATPPGS